MLPNPMQKKLAELSSYHMSLLLAIPMDERSELWRNFTPETPKRKMEEDIEEEYNKLTMVGCMKCKKLFTPKKLTQSFCGYCD